MVHKEALQNDGAPVATRRWSIDRNYTNQTQKEEHCTLSQDAKKSSGDGKTLRRTLGYQQNCRPGALKTGFGQV